MSVIIFTSCIEPNTDITVANDISRVDEVVANIRSFFTSGSHHVFEDVILVDCSNCRQAAEKLFKKVSEQVVDVNITCLHITFSQEERRDVSFKGKGYSELLMLVKAVDRLPSIGENILKLSARYKPYSWQDFLKELNLSDQDNRIKVTFSNFRRVALTYAFSISVSTLRDFDDRFRELINDSSGRFIEHNFYEFLTQLRPEDVHRVYLHKYFDQMVSGSTGKKAGTLKTLARKIVYRL
ncbi:hypothetical protein SPH72_09650 [Rhodobacterales bacterium FZCC0083]|nr:hypothetical protein SPH72_09650 [Rhodobacterales bacterium FZCC0083]